MTAGPRLSQSWSLHSLWVLSAEVQVGGGKKRHRLFGSWLSINQAGDHRLSLVILCVVRKPDERSPACWQPAVVLKMQTSASGHGIGNRQRKEAGLCPPLLVLPSALATCNGKLDFTLVLKDTVGKKKKIKTTIFQGPVVSILKFYLEQVLKMRRMNSHFILMQNKF